MYHYLARGVRSGKDLTRLYTYRDLLATTSSLDVVGSLTRLLASLYSRAEAH